MSVELVRVNKYSRQIKELPVYKRIAVEYPLLVRDVVAKKLADVVENLPKGLHLQVDSAYRTRQTQTKIWYSRQIQLGDGAKDLVFDPKLGVPPHTTGGAVDVSLLDENGDEIDLSEPFSKFYNEPKLRSDKITKNAQKHRNLLNSLMIKEGFAPNPSEYWHFSYGDEYWAEYTGKDALYQELELLSDKYYRKSRHICYKIIRKFWKLHNRIFRIQTNY
jgi:D-alanyl-D-alanine dipeptidase